MKKLIRILFLFAYIAPTVGVTVAYHFCGNTLSTVIINYNGNLKEPSECCGEEHEDNNCCHNDIKIYRLDDLHFASLKTELANVEYSLIDLTPTELIFAEIPQTQSNTSFNSNSPPEKAVYIQNRNLRI